MAKRKRRLEFHMKITGSAIFGGILAVLLLIAYLAYGPIIWAFIAPAESGPKEWVAYALVGGGAWQLAVGILGVLSGIVWCARKRAVLGIVVILVALLPMISGGYLLKSAYEQQASRQG